MLLSRRRPRHACRRHSPGVQHRVVRKARRRRTRIPHHTRRRLLRVRHHRRELHRPRRRHTRHALVRIHHRQPPHPRVRHPGNHPHVLLADVKDLRTEIQRRPRFLRQLFRQIIQDNDARQLATLSRLVEARAGHRDSRRHHNSCRSHLRHTRVRGMPRSLHHRRTAHPDVRHSAVRQNHTRAQHARHARRPPPAAGIRQDRSVRRCCFRRHPDRREPHQAQRALGHGSAGRIPSGRLREAQL